MSSEIIKCEEISRRFGSHVALDNITFSVGRGEKIVVIGPSGAGKSTLFRCINALEEIDSGKITIDDVTLDSTHRDIAKVRADVGFVFQHFHLFPHLTVLGNITLAQTVVRKKSQEESTETARILLNRFGLLDKEQSYPSELSGGQCQRAAICRAMALNPKILLFDEATSALDPEMMSEVVDVMNLLAREGITLMIVTHELGVAREVADRVIFMDDGRIEAIGTVEEILVSPENERVKTFLAKVLA
ncbi:MAG: amino acid ABC transporter ATP-binding protein [Candidatus Zixiibacteriota bacterium]